MASKNEDNWLANYEELKAHVIGTGHFFNKHNKLCNWAKYQRKRIKAGTMPEEQKVMFEALEKMRSGEHTYGRAEEEIFNELKTNVASHKWFKTLTKQKPHPLA